MWRHVLLASAALVLALSAVSAAQNHAELEWQTLATEHFQVHYHQGAERTARRAAAIVEEIYPAITGLYDYEPKAPTHLIIRDTDDFSNGAAFYYDDKFEIWATALEFNLRGTHNWLRDVITHEYTHMVSIQAAHRLPHRMPAIYLQGFGYEEEKRRDVLVGYPNVIVSYPITGTLVSAWWAEGVAQYQTSKLYNDWWDSHRDMLLRSAVLDSTLLTYEQMGNLNKSGLEAEMVYNQGYAFVRWIAANYGEETLRTVTRDLTSFWAVSESKALEKATGKTGKELYDAWKSELENAYGAFERALDTNHIGGEIVSDGGYLNLYPRFQPGSRELYWASNRGHDFGTLSLVRLELGAAPVGTVPAVASDSSSQPASGRAIPDIESVTGGINTPPTFSADGSRIYYSKRTERNRYGSRLNDIYVFDIAAEEEERLTHDLRAKDPSPSPDGTKLAAVLNADGTNELVLLNGDGSLDRRLTQDSPHGTQYYQPRWSPDGTQLLYTTFDGVSRDMVLLDLDSGEQRLLAPSPADERDPAFVPGEDAVVFACDRTGVFNIYRLELDSGALSQVTNVKGGAVYPAVADDGTLAFSAFAGGGYQIRSLAPGTWGSLPAVPAAAVEPRGDYRLVSGGPEALSLTEAEFFDADSKPYKEAFPVTQIMPRLLVDNGKPRVGAYLASREVLDRQSLFGGASVGRRFNGFEFELFALYENRMLPVTVFGEAFRVRRRSEDIALSKIVGGDFHVGEVRPVNLELRYDLWEVDAGVRWEWGPRYSFLNYKNLSAFYVHQDYNINLFATDAIDGIGYGKDGWSYYVGDAAHVRFDYRSVERAVDADINPRGGRQIMARYAYNWARLNPQGNRTTDTFDPLYENNNFGEYEVDWREFVGLPWGRHTLELRARGAAIDDTRVDDFFWFPVGSRPGLRGYTFYTRQGRKLGVGGVTYRFPIWREIDHRVASLFLHRLYGGVFFEAGNTWDAEGFTGLRGGDLLKDAGFELRLETTSFYVFPANIYVEGAYGFDEIAIRDEELDVNLVIGGKSWQYYVGLLFGF